MDQIIEETYYQHKNALEQLKCGSYVITGTFDYNADIYAVARVTKISSRPPLVSIVAKKRSEDYELIINSDYLIIHLVSENQIDNRTLRLKKNVIHKKISSFNEVPIMSGSCAVFGCKKIGMIETHDQIITIAEIDYSELDQTKNPMILDS
jgi:flavin reductase (DIM6/NTAB) family NADH-FMN oxidoreductase RutF